MGICAKCRENGPLRKSHSIPRSFILPILQSNNGQGIQLSGGKEKVHRSNNSGASPMLCENCEIWFNEKIDMNADIETKKMRRTIAKSKDEVAFSTDNQRIVLFILSVFWRASISENKLCQDFNLREQILHQIEHCFSSPKIHDPFKFASCRIANITDKANHFDDAHLQQIVSWPNIAKGPDKSKIEMHFVARGLYFSASIPRQQYAKIKKNRLIQKRGLLRIKNEDIFDLPGMLCTVVESLRKEKQGFSTL